MNVEDPPTPNVLFSIDPVTRAAMGRIERRVDCGCLTTRGRKGTPGVPTLHAELQDQGGRGWSAVVALIEEIAAAGAAVFEPAAHLAWDDWMDVVTLPATLGTLTAVEEVRLYGSHLRRLPPEIGRMTALRDLDIYTSHALHWLPYEVTRCRNLADSRMSTRALYGNRNTLLPFPRLRGPVEALTPSTCSVCDRPFEGRTPRLYWTSQWVGTDVTPLLIHGCSHDCLLSVPSAPEGYHERPHKGGGGVGMPVPRYSL